MEKNICYNIAEDGTLQDSIDYVSLKEADFNGFDVRKEPLLDIPDGKYLSDVIDDSLIIRQESNTVVINSSVGQGKSTFAVDLVKKYIFENNDDDQYNIIFAVPHRSLINQYIKKLRTTMNRDLAIADYNNLVDLEYDSSDFYKNSKEARSYNNIRRAKYLRVHVVTVDCLLGSAGKAIEQKAIKRKYLDSIIDATIEKNRKIILVYDEIHDAIDNFKPELIYNLWKFKTRNVLHKTFILSATFNEASKVVIKYIAELTDKKLQIIESARIQPEEDKLSNLHLYVTQKMHYDFKDTKSEVYELVKEIIDKHDNLDILSYSKDLSIKLTNKNSSIVNLLTNKWKVNLSISKHHYEKLNKKKDFLPEISFNEEYKEDCCNVGTMFKTGISIEKENTAFVIILPVRVSMVGFVDQNDYGIFYDGIINLVQGIARVRKKSDIYVIMPVPNELIIPAIQNINSESYNYLTLLSGIDILEGLKERAEDKMKQLREAEYKNTGKDKNIIYTYSELYSTHQKSLIEDVYNRIRGNISTEIDYITTLEKQEPNPRTGLPPLYYPSLDEFILNKGENLLFSRYAIFGKDLPAYMLWAAFNNQFVNCKIKSIIVPHKEPLEIEEGKIQDALYGLFIDYYGDNLDEFTVCDSQLYDKFCDIIFSKEIQYRGNKAPITKSNSMFQRHIMAFIQKSIKGNDSLNKKYHKETDGHIQDIPFEAEDYLLCCIANANQYAEEETTRATESYKLLIYTYKKLGEIRQLFLAPTFLMTNPRDNKPYIYRDYTKYDSLFSIELINEIINVVRIIQDNDKCFKYFGKFQDMDYNNIDKTFTSIYNLLKETFFQITKKDQKELTSIAREKGRETRFNIEYVEITELPTKRTGINLLYKYDYMEKENYEDEILEQKAIDEYNDSQLDLDRPISENDLKVADEISKLVENLKKDNSQEEKA